MLIFVALICEVFCVSIVSEAINLIVKKDFVKQFGHYEVIIHGENSLILGDIADGILKEAGQPMKLIRAPDNDENIEIRNSAVFLFDTWRAYKNFHKRLRTSNRFPKKFSFLVFVDEIDEQQEEQLKAFEPLRFSVLSYETFVKKSSNGSVSLYNLETFQQPNCSEVKLIRWNEFMGESKKWKNEIFFPRKYFSFNGCELIVGLPFGQEPLIFVHFVNGIFSNAWGYGVRINEELSKALNYTYYYNPLDIMRKAVYNQTVQMDFMIVVFSQRHLEKNDKLQMTHTFSRSDQVIVITKGKIYTPFEKLILPFDFEVWVWLMITAAVSFAVVSILLLAPEYVQKFVFGSRVKTPLMNLL